MFWSTSLGYPMKFENQNTVFNKVDRKSGQDVTLGTLLAHLVECLAHELRVRLEVLFHSVNLLLKWVQEWSYKKLNFEPQEAVLGTSVPERRRLRCKNLHFEHCEGLWRQQRWCVFWICFAQWVPLSRNLLWATIDSPLPLRLLCMY